MCKGVIPTQYTLNRCHLLLKERAEISTEGVLCSQTTLLSFICKVELAVGWSGSWPMLDTADLVHESALNLETIGTLAHVDGL